MIRERELFFIKSIKLLDLLLIIGAFYIAYIIQPVELKANYPVYRYLWFVLTAGLVWFINLKMQNVYASFRTRKITEELKLVLRAGLYTFIMIYVLVYFLKISYLDDQFVLIFSFYSTFLICLGKLFLMLFFRYVRKKGYNYKHVLVVGTGERTGKFIETINNNPQWGLRIIGLVDKNPDKLGQKVHGIEVIGILEEVSNIIRNRIIDEVVFVVPRLWLNEIESPIHECETLGIKVTLMLDLFNLRISKVQISKLGDLPLLCFETVFMQEWQLLVKRVVDILISLISLIVCMPLFFIIAVLIKLTSKGPVFFRQIRNGINGREFNLIKFRTMVVGAELRKKEILGLNLMKGPVFKAENDPRLTKIGRFLRIASLDEIPQLINVLLGDMSLVGPRPALPEEVYKYEDWQRRRLSMKPGITCIWQVSGRNKIDFNEWMKLDLYYIDNWSLGLDFMILFKTIPAVLLGKGAK